jgi:hypothetical protein
MHTLEKKSGGGATTPRVVVSPSTMGKIQRQKMPKQGHRGRLGLSGLSAPRAKSRKVERAPIVRRRDADYEKFEALKKSVEELSTLERDGWVGMSGADAKAKAKELKILRGKLAVKEAKHGGGGK